APGLRSRRRNRRRRSARRSSAPRLSPRRRRERTGFESGSRSRAQPEYRPCLCHALWIVVPVLVKEREDLVPVDIEEPPLRVIRPWRWRAGVPSAEVAVADHETSAEVRVVLDQPVELGDGAQELRAKLG